MESALVNQILLMSTAQPQQANFSTCLPCLWPAYLQNASEAEWKTWMLHYSVLNCSYAAQLQLCAARTAAMKLISNQYDHNVHDQLFNHSASSTQLLPPVSTSQNDPDVSDSSDANSESALYFYLDSEFAITD